MFAGAESSVDSPASILVHQAARKGAGEQSLECFSDLACSGSQPDRRRLRGRSKDGAITPVPFHLLTQDAQALAVPYLPPLHKIATQPAQTFDR